MFHIAVLFGRNNSIMFSIECNSGCVLKILYVAIP